MLVVSELFIYPVKSLGGIRVTSATITSRGFQHDRRWMLVDENNLALTQRELAQMALLKVEFVNEGLKITHKKDNSSYLIIPFIPKTNEKIAVRIFDDTCYAQLVDDKADGWFTKALNFKCRLVYMPESSIRVVDGKYAFNNEITSFTDGFPYLIIGQSTLDDLNKRLPETLPVNRFRPNIVFTGGNPYEEDSMKHFEINSVNFYGVKLCARCVITTIDQDDASKANEPLKTMATYRSKNNKIYFGQNLLAKGNGTINIGDAINVLELNSSDPFKI